MSRATAANRELAQLVDEVAKATGVSEDEVRKVLTEVTVRHVRRLAAELSRTTGVREEDIVKVLEGLGVPDALSLAPLGAMRHVGLAQLQGAVRNALLQVDM